MRGEAVTRTGYFTIRLTEHRRKILDYIAVHANAGSVFNAPVDLVDYALVHAAMCDRELRTSNGSNLRRAALSIVIRNGKAAARRWAPSCGTEGRGHAAACHNSNGIPLETWHEEIFRCHTSTDRGEVVRYVPFECRCCKGKWRMRVDPARAARRTSSASPAGVVGVAAVSVAARSKSALTVA
jgi:hypothetical protein